MTEMVRRSDAERGVALVIALMSMTLLLTLGGALILLSSSETGIAANFRAAHEARYAADAAIERALADLRREPDFTPILTGGLGSSFVDGLPSGTRTLIDGSSIDLDEITNLANCGKPTPCSVAELAATTTERPWGANNPRWTLYAYGSLANMLDGPIVRSGFYVIAFLGDDASENDGDPTLDGFSVGGAPNPGRGIVRLRAEAFGSRNVHSVIEATVSRIELAPAAPGEQPSTELRVLSRSDIR
jgi:type IV pilus assembly PilX-like protein